MPLRVSSTTPTIRARHYINRELTWEDGRYTIRFGDIIRSPHHSAWVWCEILVIIITPILPSNPITWAAADAKEILVVCIASPCQLLRRGGLYFRHSERWDTTNMAFLACNRCVVCGVHGSGITILGDIEVLIMLLQRQLRQYHASGSQFLLDVLSEVVDEPHDCFMAVPITLYSTQLC